MGSSERTFLVRGVALSLQTHDGELTKLLSHRSLLPHGAAAPYSGCDRRGLAPWCCAHRKRILHRT